MIKTYNFVCRQRCTQYTPHGVRMIARVKKGRRRERRTDEKKGSAGGTGHPRQAGGAAPSPSFPVVAHVVLALEPGGQYNPGPIW